MAAYRLDAPRMRLTLSEGDEAVGVAHVSREHFPLFGVRLMLGRPFSAEEDRPHAARVAIVSQRLWRQRH